jgi:glycosyltransferase involved in cell wall biosynthesis
VAYVGRVYPDKGVHLLPAALHLAQRTLGRPLTLEVAGNGPGGDAIRRDAARLAVPLRWHGWMDGEALTSWLRACDAVVLPSLWPEPFGLAGLDAGRLGVPAAAFPSGGIPEWLTDGINGHLAPAVRTDAAALADALVRVLGAAGHWQRLREGAWRASAEWTLTSHLDAVEPALTAACRGR